MRCLLLLPAILILLLATVGCGSRRHDSRLEEIAGIVADSPYVAITRLDSIDPAMLSNRDRHYYDLLSIKARDKAYITHTSDSLILDVIDYYSSHQGSGLYPEALYYGGRVFCDLGDYPTALKYFQDALSDIPDNNEYLYLKGCITSQTGRLLNQLRLRDQAIPYLEQAINIDSVLNRISDLAYDHQLLGAILMHQGKFDVATTHFTKALLLSYGLDEEDQISMKVYLAANQYCKGSIDSALILMRGLPEICRPGGKSVALTYATRIYLQSGILDTAYMYAHELAYIKNSKNRKTGFQLLLSPELSMMIQPDSMRKFVIGFRQSMEEYLNQNEATEAMIQDSYYNYNKHIRDKEALKAINEHITRVLVIVLFFASMLCGLSIYLKYHNTRQALQLRDTLNLVSDISSELSEIKSVNSVRNLSVTFPTTEDELRQQLLDRLESIERSDVTLSIPETILSSDLYKTLTTLIKQGKGLSDNNPIWRDIETSVLTHSPNFKNSLLKLTNGKMSKADLQIALLVRFGITPMGMATLLNLTPSSISSRRSNLCKKMFGRNMGAKASDVIILSL